MPAWFAREGFPPGQWGRLLALALALEIDHNGLAGPLDPLRRPPR
ncbi:putative quorum-sensing-regulated virulence factor [Rhodanobacter sp. UC4436_H3]